jgi:dUTPase
MEKKKRYYDLNEKVWVKPLKATGYVKEILKETKDVKVLVYGEIETVKLWEIDKFKDFKNKKVTYLAPVNGGVVPTKDKENAGRDCYARIEPKVVDGKTLHEMYIPRFTVGKIPLGFASYLDEQDYLSLKHERSSIGSTGLISVSGLVDSTYQGEVVLQVIPLVADVVITSEVEEKYFDESLNTYFIPYGKAICQAVIGVQSDAEDIEITYEELLEKPSSRGTGGWGSTGK